MKYIILFIFICSNAFADIRLSCEITYSAGFKVDNANRNYKETYKNLGYSKVELKNKEFNREIYQYVMLMWKGI